MQWATLGIRITARQKIWLDPSFEVCFGFCSWLSSIRTHAYQSWLSTGHNSSSVTVQIIVIANIPIKLWVCRCRSAWWNWELKASELKSLKAGFWECPAGDHLHRRSPQIQIWVSRNVFYWHSSCSNLWRYLLTSEHHETFHLTWACDTCPHYASGWL